MITKPTSNVSLNSIILLGLIIGSVGCSVNNRKVKISYAFQSVVPIKKEYTPSLQMKLALTLASTALKYCSSTAQSYQYGHLTSYFSSAKFVAIIGLSFSRFLIQF
jgi:hypothetical protein